MNYNCGTLQLPQRSCNLQCTVRLSNSSSSSTAQLTTLLTVYRSGDVALCRFSSVTIIYIFLVWVTSATAPSALCDTLDQTKHR